MFTQKAQQGEGLSLCIPWYVWLRDVSEGYGWDEQGGAQGNEEGGEEMGVHGGPAALPEAVASGQATTMIRIRDRGFGQGLRACCSWQMLR